MDWFKLGGFGMWITLVWGSAFIAATIRFAVSPQRQVVPLVVSLGLVTLLSGAFGFTTGLIESLGVLSRVPADERYIAWIGLGESLYNVAFATGLVLLGAVIAAAGTLRLARAPAADPAPAR